MESRRLEKRLNERFIKAMATYHLIEDDDHILVGLSGGKDSLLLLELLAKRSRISHPRFKVEALHVRMDNIHYETDTSYLQQFCDDLGVTLHVRTTSFEVFNEETENNEIINLQSPTSKLKRKQKQPCFLCSWNRRKQMFNLAQELGCNKIAFGHHKDDIVETLMMNLIFEGKFSTIYPKLQMNKMPLQLIRPLCLIEEKDLRRYAQLRGYVKQKQPCPFEKNSSRADVKELITRLEQMNPNVRDSMWGAIARFDKNA